ncbi:hypothetical protein Tco_0490363 [Tanacetum coccineum]
MSGLFLHELEQFVFHEEEELPRTSWLISSFDIGAKHHDPPINYEFLEPYQKLVPRLSFDADIWATAKAKTINGEVQIQALVDGKKVIITEASARRDLQLADENGTECLPNATIFAELERMGSKTTAWNEFSSIMASVVICLATNQKFNFSKYIFDNMVKNLDSRVNFLMYPSAGKDFFGRDTSLFQTMMVQAQEEGEGSAIPTDPHHTPTTTQPSTSKPQKKQSKRKQRKDTGIPQSYTSQAAEITELKERVKKLERRNKSRTSGLKRLRKVGRSARIESSKDEDLEVILVDEAQERNDDNLMFDTRVFDEQEVEVEKVVSTAEVTTASATTTTVDELTLAQTLIEIKAAKPKAVTTAATITTTVVTRPKARGVVVQEPNQILIDEEIGQKLQAQLNAELEEEEKLAKQKEEDENIVEWDNVQAMIDADYELAARL